MSRYLATRESVAIREHGCETCNEPSARPGDLYAYDVMLHDGQVHTYRQCPACRGISGRVLGWISHYEEGASQEDYAEWAAEVVRDEASPDYADAVAYLGRVRGAR